jgi:hypothetical protein
MGMPSSHAELVRPQCLDQLGALTHHQVARAMLHQLPLDPHKAHRWMPNRFADRRRVGGIAASLISRADRESLSRSRFSGNRPLLSVGTAGGVIEILHWAEGSEALTGRGDHLRHRASWVSPLIHP